MPTDASPFSAGRPWAVVVTAEHGGHEVPEECRPLFVGHEEVLRSHRGWDPGTLHLARELAAATGGRLFAATISRLVVELNRSAHHPSVFSFATRALPLAERQRLLERYHTPHRQAVREEISALVRAGRRVLHLGVHSFTPELNGEVRNADLTLLYDPKRPTERALASSWLDAFDGLEPSLRRRRNYPYRGDADGLTTTLRTFHSDAEYSGIEIEVNQKHLGADGRFPGWARDGLVQTLSGLIRLER